MTRPFEHFDVASPKITDTRQTAIDKTRYNQIVLYLNDAVNGGIGWNGPAITRDAQSRIASALYHNIDDTVAVRIDVSYYAKATEEEILPEDGLQKLEEYWYSEDYDSANPSAATWEKAGSREYTYDANRNMQTPVWRYA